jgi:hypothetical protein
MPSEFHSRFHIEVAVSTAKKRFVNRALNRIFDDYIFELSNTGEVKMEIASALGDYYYSHKSIKDYIDDDFYRCLLALETAYRVAVGYGAKEGLNALINDLFSDAEIDLDVRWRDECFFPAGAAELDTALVNHNLDWLKEAGWDTVLSPYRKGLHTFLDSQKRQELLSDVITDMYEAFEAMIKLVTGKKTASRETFLKRSDALGISPLAKEYAEYAHRFRHGDNPTDRRRQPLESEVETFIYLTGIFLRLASRTHKAR